MTDQHRRGKCRDHRNRHDHRIQEITGDRQRRTECRDNIGELTDLRQAKGRLDRGGNIFAGHHHTKRQEEYLAHDGYHGNQQNGQQIINQRSRHHQQTDRNKEYRTEQVFTRGDQMFDLITVQRPGQNGTGQKSTESRGKTYGIGDPHHPETYP